MIMVVEVVAFSLLKMLAFVRLPSLHGYCACMVFWLREHSGEIAGKNCVRPLFLVLEFFCVVGHPLFGGEVYLSGSCGLVGARHPFPDTAIFVVEVFNVGGWLTHGHLVLGTEVDFLAVVEHRLIPAKYVVSGPGFVGKGWPLSGRQLLTILPMLVMLGLGSSILLVLQSLRLPLQLRNLTVL